MHETGMKAPRWPAAVMSRSRYEEAFEPAWHEAHALSVSRQVGRGPLGRLLERTTFGVRTVSLVAQCAMVGEAEAGGDGWARAFGSELKIATRGLRKRPGFALVSALTLAVGVGATTSIFSVLNGVLLRPLPFPDPDRLVTMEIMGPRGFPISLSMLNLRDWRERNRSFTGFSMVAPWSLTRTSENGATVLDSYAVGGDFFEVLGVEPLIGRWFDGAETERGSAAVVVIGYGYWQREFAGDRSVIGQSMTLGGRPATIIGVLPPDIGYPRPEIEAYFPVGALSGVPWEDRNSSFGGVVLARLRSDASIELSQSDMDRVTQGVEEEEGQKVASVTVQSVEDAMLGQARRPLWVLMGAAISVLLIAVVNVANLLLARSESRRMEVAVRVAMGAGRATLARQMLAEGIALSSAGLAFGVVVAFAGVALVRRFVPLPPLADDVSIDTAALLFAVVTTLVVGLVFAAVPAVRDRSATSAALRESGRTTDDGARQRLRSTFVVAEMALALILTIGAGLMVQSLIRLGGANAGFGSRNVITARLRPPGSTYPDAARYRGYYDEVMERLRAEPGVENVAASLLVPLADRSWELLVQPEGEPYDRRQGESVLFNIVSQEYFATMSIPILRGRGFEDADRDGAMPVVIIDETMAQRFWPGEDPIGKRIAMEEAEGSTASSPIPVYRTVVGIAPNVRHYDLRAPSRIQAWVPFHQSLRNWGASLYIDVRVARDANGFAPRLRDAVRSVDRMVPISNVQTMESYVIRHQQPDRAMSGMLTAFGALALGLAAIGVFGVMSLIVAMRSREIGIRVAVGAEPQQILRLVFGRTLALSVVGVACGLAGAVALSRLLDSFLFEVSPLEPTIYIGAALFMIGVAVLATLLPALRALRIDPVRTLQEA